MNVHFWTFVFQIFNFVVVAFVLHRVLYRPLHEAIDRRRQATEQLQAEAARAKADAEALRAALDAERVELEHRRETLVREAHRQAEAEGQRLLDDARRRAQRQSTELHQQLEHERDEALAAVQKELLRLAVELAERLLKQSADRTLHRQLVLRLAESLERASVEERRQLQMAWTAADAAVIETAEELDRESIARLSAAVTALVGQKVTLTPQLKPELISGACLRLGGHIWDASIRGPLQETPREEVRETVHA